MGNVYDTDPELKSLVGFFDDLINQNPTFDSFMDLTDESQDLDVACLKFKIRDDFIGNTGKGFLYNICYFLWNQPDIPFFL